MNRLSTEHDLANLLSPNRGYIVRREFLTTDQADRYRNESDQFLRTAKAIFKKIHRYYKHDYIWSVDGKVVPGMYTYRIYQSLYAKHSAETEQVFDKMLSLRNEIEANWLHDERYRKSREGLYDYVQVTSYGKESKGIDKHCDYQGNVPYPLLQCLVFLSKPGVDYMGGDLILYTKQGKRINIQATAGIQKGDALLFDKSLYHEVEATLPSETSAIGRWTAVIGARYPSPALSARAERFFRAIAAKVRSRRGKAQVAPPPLE